MRKPHRKESVVFNGLTYTRYPDGKSASGRKYYYNQSNGLALHQAVWVAANGPIPRGYHIHHRDGDTGNNALDNLEMVSPGDHCRIHGNKSPAQMAHFERIRPLAAGWHASEEGRAWHSEHGKRTWVGRKGEPRKCDQCEREYECKTGRDTDRFCSRACMQRWHYRNKTYFTPAVCSVCGGEYLRPPVKWNRTTCGSSCATRLRKRDRDSGRLL